MSLYSTNARYWRSLESSAEKRLRPASPTSPSSLLYRDRCLRGRPASASGRLRRAATYVNKILRGAKPADPVELAVKLDFNLTGIAVYGRYRFGW